MQLPMCTFHNMGISNQWRNSTLMFMRVCSQRNSSSYYRQHAPTNHACRKLLFIIINVEKYFVETVIHFFLNNFM